MKNRRAIFASLFVWLLFSSAGLVFGLIGCGQVPATSYYTFQPDPPVLQNFAPQTWPVVLAIGQFEAEPPYQQDKIVYRKSPYEVNFYEYRKWLRSTEQIVSDQIVAIIRATHRFKRVHTQPFEVAADYILQGQILMFDQWQNNSTPLVKVKLSYRLLTAADEQVVWSEVLTTTATAASLDMVETIKGFETALQTNVLQALEAMSPIVSQAR
jgi:ABC-type uncharacterized transport system auxiliary subunit